MMSSDPTTVEEWRQCITDLLVARIDAHYARWAPLVQLLHRTLVQEWQSPLEDIAAAAANGSDDAQKELRARRERLAALLSALHEAHEAERVVED